METKLQKVKNMWACGQYRAALHMVARWHRLGDHKDRIQRGWGAISNESFYKQIGEDPASLYRDGLLAVAERYDLTPPKEHATPPKEHA